MTEFRETAQVLTIIVVTTVIIVGAIVGTVFILDNIKRPMVTIGTPFVLKNEEKHNICQILETEDGQFTLKCLESEGND